MRFSVVVLPDADEAVQQIVAWLHDRSPSGAESWYRAWEDLLKRLARTASRCVRAPEDALIDVEIRQAIFKTRHGRPYRALFTIREETVYIMHVRGPRQNVMSLPDLVPPNEE